jgi:hypothetical protein
MLRRICWRTRRWTKSRNPRAHSKQSKKNRKAIKSRPMWRTLTTLTISPKSLPTKRGLKPTSKQVRCSALTLRTYSTRLCIGCMLSGAKNLAFRSTLTSNKPGRKLKETKINKNPRCRKRYRWRSQKAKSKRKKRMAAAFSD